ncbi:MAG TPA: hypothetical protein VIY72_07720 [Acidimicrobiales bacterium]
MSRSQGWSPRRVAFAAALALGVLATACSSGDGPTLPTLPSTTTTTEGGSTTTTDGRSTTTTSTSTTSTSSSTSTSTSSSTSTSTTEAPTTTTTRPTTTSTTRESTTTEDPTTTAAPATVPASSDGDSSAPWLWVAAIALLVAAAAIVLIWVTRARSAARARWVASTRDLSQRSQYLAQNLDQAAAVLGGPAGANRQVWLDATNTLDGLAASAATLAPDAPKVPGDPKGTNSLSAALERLRSSLTVCRSAVGEAERTRFELLNPTAEQLDFASNSVRQASGAVIADTHSLNVVLDRVSPPTPGAGQAGVTA